MKIDKFKKAFSLIEMSIVLVIVALLVAVIASSNKLIDNSRLAKARSLTKSSPVPEIDGLTLWLETTMPQSIADASADNGRDVSTWVDLSSERHNAIAGVAPTYIANAINGLPVLRFSGTQYLTFAGDDLVGSNYTIFVVSARGNNKDTNPILGGSTTAATFSNFGLTYFLNTTARLRIIHSGDNTTNGTSGTDFIDYACGAFSSRSFQIHSLTFNYLVGKTYYENGTQRASITSNTAKTQLVAWAGSAIGRLSFNNSGVTTSFFNGDIAEIIIFSKALSDNERKDVEQYLGKKWGITVS